MRGVAITHSDLVLGWRLTFAQAGLALYSSHPRIQFTAELW